jgi:hypothetical protein
MISERLIEGIIQGNVYVWIWVTMPKFAWRDWVNPRQFCHYSRCPMSGQRLEPVTSEYEAAVLLIRRHTVTWWGKYILKVGKVGKGRRYVRMLCSPDFIMTVLPLWLGKWLALQPSMSRVLVAWNLVFTKPYLSNVELDSTALCAVPDQLSSASRHVILQCSVLVFSKLLSSSGWFWNLKITEFLENWLGTECCSTQG